MTTLKDEALNYAPDDMLHVADLPEFSVNFELQKREKENSKGEKYTQNFFEMNGRKYQVPNKVLELMQQVLKLKPTVAKMKVHKTGSGLATKYKLEPLD